MAKSAKTEDHTTSKSKPKEGKQKKQKTNTAPPAPGSFSLFSKGKDADLDDVFSKGKHDKAAYARADLQVPVSISAPVDIAYTSKDLAKSASKERQKRKRLVPPAPSDSSESDVPGPSTVAPAQATEREVWEASDAEADEDELVHESLKAGSTRRVRVPTSTSKYVPPNETPADRDRRTIFLGNLPIEVAKSKIESIRFRSVPFATATAALPSDDPEKDDGKRVKREKERAAAWRSQQDVLEGGDQRAMEEVDRAQTFIDSKGKRKVAFIKKDFHSEAGICNAYLVFAHPHPDRPENVAPVLDPLLAATQALAANGSTFMERLIRVDSVRLPSSVALQGATTALGKRDAWLPGGTDPKKSLFVGGLDYAAKEEDVRVLFEELVKTERGAKGEGRWVTGVRIVRDKETQLGKGFGYIHFSERESVDELLAMDSAKFKFAKKYLRVQPCKTLPPTSTTKPSLSDPKAPRDKIPKPTKMPKGNPALGEQLKGLSKEERKLAKSDDTDRQARRLAKKQLKAGSAISKEKGAVKLGVTRVAGDKKPKFQAKKGRVRSEHALTKMKGSRT